MMLSAPMSSTTASARRKTRRRPGTRGPIRARVPTRKAVSVEITTPNACSCPEPLAMRTKRSAGTTRPAIAAATAQGTGPARQLPDRELPTHFEPDREEEGPVHCADLRGDRRPSTSAGGALLRVECRPDDGKFCPDYSSCSPV